MVNQNLDSAQSLNELILKIEVLKDTFGTFVAIKPLHMAFFRNRYNWVAFELSSSKKVCKDDTLGVSVYTGFTKTTFEEIISKIKGLKPNNFSTQVEVIEASAQPVLSSPSGTESWDPEMTQKEIDYQVAMAEERDYAKFGRSEDNLGPEDYDEFAGVEF